MTSVWRTLNEVSALMNGLLLIARLLLALVFAVAGVAKLVDPAGSRKSMGEFGVPAFLARPLAFLLPLPELASAVALVPGISAWWGASAALVLLVLFMVAITNSLVRGRRPDCHCFGQLHSSPVGWTTLARNALLAGLAAFVVWQGPGHAGPGLLDWLGGLSRSDSIVVGLGCAIVGVAAFEVWAVFHLLRQNGRLLLRLEAVEAKLGIGAEARSRGLPVKSPAPAFSLDGLDGVILPPLKKGDVVPSRRLSDLSDRAMDLSALRGRRTLLLFWNPSCGFCQAMLGDVKTWERHRPRDAPELLIISAGSSEANREQGFRSRVLLDPDFGVGQVFGAEGTPSAVLLDEESRVASEVCVGASAVLALAGAMETRMPVTNAFAAAPQHGA